ncbi:MAG: response regulator [Oscillospiraceae bacterium]|nr:response regulator [Oscillospiraceae bacterium]
MENMHQQQDEQSLFESVLCGILRYTLEEQPTVLQFNKACAQIFGYDSKDAFSTDLQAGRCALVYVYDREIQRGFLRRCMRVDQPINFGHRIRRRDGSIAYIMGEMRSIRLADGTQAVQEIFMDSGHQVVTEDLRKRIQYAPVGQSNIKDKLIVATDDPAERRALREILGCSYAMIEAEDGAEVLSILGKEQDEISAILVDEAIVRLDDYRLTAALKSSLLYASVPVVILAEQGSDEEQLLSYGANEFLRKPFNPNLIRLRLSNLIELRDTAIQRNAIETLVNNIPGGVVIFRLGEKLELQYASSKLAQHLGWRAADRPTLVREGLLGAVHESDRARLLANLRSAGTEPLEITFRLCSKSGKALWVQAHAVRIRMEDGHPVYQAVISPTTLREKMFQNMLDDASCGIVVSDAATQELLYVNNAAASLIEESEDAGMHGQAGAPWMLYQSRRLSAERYTALQVTHETTGRHLNMSGKLMDWNGIPARIVYATDDTESYRLQNEQLEVALNEAKKANEAKSSFLSRMSHDIRTPMNAILGMSSLALDEIGNQVAVQEYLEKISSSGQYLLGLINDILDMSKIESDRVELHLAPCTIRECMELVLLSMRTQMQQKSITFTYTATPDVPEVPVLLDKMRMQQVFFNLLSNAVKFTPAHGSIAVRVDRQAASGGRLLYRIAVQDSGVGIAPGALERIFEPFEQASPQNQGSGLGLAIVRNLLRLMGGKIHAESVLGQGTAFLAELPLRAADETTPSAPVAFHAPIEDYDFTGKKVLLVEDHPINLEIARKMLEKKGCTVIPASNGRQAVDLLLTSEPGNYHAVLMDIRMPIMNGLEAARAIRAAARQDLHVLPIIAMTANAFAEDMQQTRGAGMNAHLAKPIDVRLLYQTLQEIWS